MFLNVERAGRVLDARGVDGLLATTNVPNVFYLSGVLRRGDLATAVPRDRLAQPWVVCPRSEVDYLLEADPAPAGVFSYGVFFRELAEDEPLSEREKQVKRWGIDLDPVSSFLDGIVAALEAAGLAKGKVGYDERGLDPALVPKIEGRLPGLKLVPGAGIFREIRMVKTPEEIRRLTAAIGITEEAIGDAIALAREGMTEKEMSIAFEVGQVKRGALPNGSHVGFGRSAALGMFNFPDDRLRAGDLIRFDVGCAYEGYVSDTARTFAFGRPSEILVKYYDAILVGQKLALSLVRPGTTGAAIFEAVVEEVRRAGIPGFDRQHVGHGLGIAGGGYDAPLLAPVDNTPLEEGMVLAVEVPYYVVGLGGFQVEDTVVVTREGCRIVTRMDRGLVVLEK